MSLKFFYTDKIRSRAGSTGIRADVKASEHARENICVKVCVNCLAIQGD